jgi:hypothetical protein
MAVGNYKYNRKRTTEEDGITAALKEYELPHGNEEFRSEFKHLLLCEHNQEITAAVASMKMLWTFYSRPTEY